MTVRIIVGDAVAAMQTLPAESVQCCVTSPPYWGLRDYGEEGQLGLEATPEEYVARLVEVFREVRRVLRDDGVLWLNLGDSYNGSSATQGGDGSTSRLGGAATDTTWTRTQQAERIEGRHAPVKMAPGLKPKDLVGIPWRVAFALQADGWYLRSDVIWHKPNPMPESVRDRPTKGHEYVFLLTKRGRYYWDQDAVREEGGPPKACGPKNDASRNDSDRTGIVRGDGVTRNVRTVWTIATRPYSGAHFAVMPPALAERCILAGTSERGCCPECGAPWVRQWEHGAVLCTGGSADGARASNMATVSPLGQDPTRSAYNTGKFVQREHKTTGWAPSCDHDAAPVPCVVLDPFGGAGTTALVAQRLQRDAVVCELSPEYAAMAEERVRGDAPLLADVRLSVTERQP